MFNQNNPNLMNTLNMLMSMGNNPNQIIQNAISKDPQLQQVFSQINGQGMSTKDLALRIAQERGMDLQPILNYFNQRGIKL